MAKNLNSILFVFISISNAISFSLAYRPGDIVSMSKAGQYHGSRTVWHDVIGRHCPIFAVNREVLIPIAKPTGYTGADPYKLFKMSQKIARYGGNQAPFGLVRRFASLEEALGNKLSHKLQLKPKEMANLGFI